ncbi:substrate import-associated zinc metallohydrolase lipoprotein [Pedobacter sp. UBA5917]|jgi:substrate import-associated zinc metallohydrolase lipoprotein|uniref:substrate import-associated zinc metallohydrolase lipoprotein n=1 Tax=Pedobacter sp. UBA5917 TaxID=1947061 RepID=UPI0025E4B32C|nr:substrate import-associated zinc metallohydrolase lipoprotein [Pedobacter sp. UBA5917]
MKKIFLFLVLLIVTLVSCKKEKPLNVDITKSNLDTYTKGKLDKWLDDNFLNPYNIEVLYRFDRFQASIDKEIAPVLEDNVQPIMEGVSAVFIKPYLEITNKAFLLPILPKEIALFGTGEYSDEQITLGTADAGRQINLYEVNQYDRNSYTSVMGTPGRPAAFHTMHHEFTHILNQNIPVPPGYEEISSNYIGSAWVGAGNSAATAKGLGFITRYARNNKNEDFAEMTSTLLVEGQDFFEAYVVSADAVAAAKLRKKEQVVVDYFKTAFGIDFRALQAKVRLAIETYAPVTISRPIENFNAGSYTGFLVDKNAASQGAAYVTAFNSANALTTAGGYPLQNTVELSFLNRVTNRTDMVLKVRTNTAVEFWYNLKATVSVPGNTIKYALAAQGTATQYANGTAFQTRFKPLLDYLTTKTFALNWIDNIVPNSRNISVGFFDTSNSQLGFYGTITRN